MTGLTEQIQAIDGFVWQPFAMPLVLLLVGGALSVMTGVVQIRRFPLAVRMVIRSMRGTSDGDGTITPQSETRKPI